MCVCVYVSFNQQMHINMYTKNDYMSNMHLHTVVYHSFQRLTKSASQKLTTSPDWLQYTLNYFSKVKVQYNKISTQIRQLHKFVDRVPGHPKGSTKKHTSRPKSSLENGLQSHVKNSNTCRDANGNDNRKAMRFGGDWTSQSLRIWLDA